MHKVVSPGRGFPASSSTTSAKSATGIQCSAAAQSLNFKIVSVYKLIILTLATTCPSTISADVSFSFQSTSYKCGHNVICRGQAHEYTVEESNGIQVVRSMSLISESVIYMQNSAGLVYYNEPVRLVDPSTRQSASFATNFQLDVRPISPGTTGDGMTFVMSADNFTVGSIGDYFGIFDSYGITSFKTIVVEFDGYKDNFPPMFDIDNNHVSFDFSNITTPATRSASTVNVSLWDNITIHAWVEYSSETQQLEVRVSHNDSRPTDPLLNYTVNMFDVAEEYMWVGFAAGNSGERDGSWTSNYYVGNWTFQTYGIASSSPAPPSPAPSNSWSSTSARKNVGLIVGISVGVPALLACSLIVFFVQRSPVKDSNGIYNLFGCPGPILFEDDFVISLEPGIMPEQFTYDELSVATGGFTKASKLGQGGFGSVHRGVLPSSGIPVAVKKINDDSTQGLKEFMTEVSIICQLRHRNLIQLLGWCRDVHKEKYLLVYELMPNGSLDKALFPASVRSQTSCLSWQRRFNILTGTAAALDYLHQGWKQKVIHRDIKSSNIMLDQDWNAKLGDFGLARLVDHERTAAMTAMAGTYGYIAPEVLINSGKFTDKADVYAFGVVALEVACGRKALLADVPEDEIFIANWVWHRLQSEDGLLSVVDKRLHDYDRYWMEVVLTIGLLCVHPNALDRPSMRDVVQILSGDAPVPSLPCSKPCLFFSF